MGVSKGNFDRINRINRMGGRQDGTNHSLRLLRCGLKLAACG
jgi:hypothetical protein